MSMKSSCRLLRSSRQPWVGMMAAVLFLLTCFIFAQPGEPIAQNVSLLTYPPEEEAAALNANPVSEQDESAALRIDPFMHVLTLVRGESRRDFRYPADENNLSDDGGVCDPLEIQTTDVSQTDRFAEIRLIFYCKFWRRVLPIRAGPLNA